MRPLVKQTTTIRARTITRLMDKTTKYHLNCRDVDVVNGVETHIINVELIADSCVYSLDIGKLWLTESRWKALIRQYVDAESLDRFIKCCVEILTKDSKRGGTSTNMLFKDPQREARKHKWGGCLMGIVFNGRIHSGCKPLLTMYSRTTYMGYLGLLDVAIPALIAREITRAVSKEKCNMTPNEIGFRWEIASMQIHCFKIWGFIHSDDELFMRLKELTTNKTKRDSAPITWSRTTMLYNRIIKKYKLYGTDMLEHLKYGPFKRLAKRWLEYNGYVEQEPPKTCKIKTLDFSTAE